MKAKNPQQESAAKALQQLQRLLDEKLSLDDESGRRKTTTVRKQILLRLLKEATEGNASAARVIAKQRKAFAQAFDYWTRAKRRASAKSLEPFARGGVLVIPAGYNIDKVVTHLVRLPDDEAQHDFMALLWKEEAAARAHWVERWNRGAREDPRAAP